MCGSLIYKVAATQNGGKSSDAINVPKPQSDKSDNVNDISSTDAYRFLVVGGTCQHTLEIKITFKREHLEMLSAYPKHALNSKKEIGNPLWNERSISRSKPVYLNGRPGGKDNPFHSAIRYPTYDFTFSRGWCCSS